MDFPTLKDNDFPHLQNVNVYGIRNDIDYTQYTSEKVVYLTHVLWDDEYRNVVDWCAYETKRDNYFKALPNTRKIELPTGYAHPISDSIKLPISYQDAQQYNYLYYEMPVLQNDAAILDYQPRQVERYFYFVVGIDYISPNTTQFRLKQDLWTTWVNDVNISYMELDRGHYAVANSAKVDEYLTNPIEHTHMLLTDDVTYGTSGGTVIKSVDVHSLERGESYVVFVSTMGLYHFNEMCGMDPTPTAPSPADWVNGNPADYSWGYGEFDYTDFNVPRPRLGSTDGRVMGSLYNYAVDADIAWSFIEHIIEYSPQFLMTLQCAFSVRKEFVSVEHTVDYRGFTVNYCHGVYGAVHDKVTFDKSMWRYESKYAELTKLYTAPYSFIELDDGSGNSTLIEPQKCGEMDIKIFASLCYPVLNIQAVLEGVSGNESVRYSVIKLSDDEDMVEVPSGDWYKAMVAWDVPCFAVFVAARDVYDYTRQPHTKAARNTALTGYYNSYDKANADYAATDAIAAQKKANDDRTSNTKKSTADNTANTDLANVNRSNATLVSNQALAVNNADTITGLTDGLDADLVTVAHTSLDDGVTLSNNTQSRLEQIANEQTAATSQNIGGQQLVVGALGGIAAGAAAGATTGGPIGAGVGMAGAILGMVSAGVASYYTGENSTVAIGATSQHSAAIQYQNSENRYILERANYSTRDLNIAYRDAVNDSNNDTNTAITAANANTSNTNAAAHNATQLANNTYWNSTELTNNAATYNGTMTAAGITRDNIIGIARRTADNAQTVEGSGYESASHERVAQIGTYAGDLKGDAFSRRSITLRVRTVQDDAIRQNGDYFLRYGYAYNGNVTPQSLQVMREFTYWKCSDLWVTSEHNTASTVDAIRDIMMRGTTVWTNPENIGRVSIYDN